MLLLGNDPPAEECSLRDRCSLLLLLGHALWELDRAEEDTEGFLDALYAFPDELFDEDRRWPTVSCALFKYGDSSEDASDTWHFSITSANPLSVLEISGEAMYGMSTSTRVSCGRFGGSRHARYVRRRTGSRPSALSSGSNIEQCHSLWNNRI